jgi:RNA polymerase sigma-70 factor (ECF subfamily)
LTALYERGQSAHPGLALPAAVFQRFLQRTDELTSAASLERLAIEDLYLACACTQGTRGAAARFESLYGSVIKRSVARTLLNPKDREEAAQKARQVLLVGENAKIAQYRGKGPLEHWVAVAVIRIAVSTGRSETAERRLRQKLVAQTIGPENPEARFIRAQLKEAVERAIAEALEGLESSDRLLLRLYLVGGMSASAIARTLGVNQTTIGRRIQRIRDRLFQKIMRSLKRANLAPNDLRSIMGIVSGSIDVSLSRLLSAH